MKYKEYDVQQSLFLNRQNENKYFYCASGLDNKENVRCFIDFMKSKNYICTLDWTLITNEYDSLHIDEVNAINLADFVVVLLPGKRGTHFEMGYAIGKNKPVYLYNIDDVQSSIPFYKFCKPLNTLLSNEDISNIKFNQ